MSEAGLLAEQISVVFAGGPILAVERLAIAPGIAVALTGPSGSGKTTLLHVLAGVLRPTTGSVVWGDRDIAKLSEGRRDAWRRRAVGLVFQDFHLIEQLSPVNNVLLPATFSNFAVPAALRQRADELLRQFKVPVEAKSVTRLSRGERQRVAVARALLFDPPVLLADEPTASLDEAAAVQVAEALASVVASGRTAIIASHDPIVAQRCARVIRLEHGHIVSDSMNDDAAVTTLSPEVLL